MTDAQRDAAYLAHREDQLVAALRLTPLERLQWLAQAKEFAQLAAEARGASKAAGEAATVAANPHAGDGVE